MKNLIVKFFLLALPFLCMGCEGYTKKDGEVYHRWFHGGNWTIEYTLVEGADASTFKTIRNNLNIQLGKDKNYVYFFSEVLEEADPLTFEQIYRYYWKDINYVYLLGFGNEDCIIRHADPYTFETLNKYWAKDKNGVYYTFDRLNKVNPENFEAIDEKWGKDDNYYYWENLRITELNYSHAEIVSSYYIKDDKNVFFKDKIVKNANPVTFKPAGVGYFGYDDKNMFTEDEDEGPITEKYRKTYIDKK